MDSADLEVLRAASRWAAAGRALTLVTVVRTWGSSPRPAGSLLALRDDGALAGSVSGGCIEDDLVFRLRHGGITGAVPFVLTYGVSRDEAARFGLPCGGQLELLVEPAPDAALLAHLCERVAAGELVARRVRVGRRGASLHPAGREQGLEWDGQTLVAVHGPRWRLLLIGAGQLSRYVAEMALALDYAVVVCDPRSEHAAEWNLPQASLVTMMPDDAVRELAPDAHTAIVALTHDPKLDDLALLEALKSPAFYVGALGSQQNNRRRRERLVAYCDLSADEVARLRGPVGLYIGSRTPAEIAVSILAEMTAVKRGVAEQVPLAGRATETGAADVAVRLV